MENAFKALHNTCLNASQIASAMANKQPKTPSKLKSGRPPLAQGQRKSTGTKEKNGVNARHKSSKATRTLINKHHQLQKARVAALAADDQQLLIEIDEQLDQLGGLAAYQEASLTGQDKNRGGDSSTKLVEWLRKYEILGKDNLVQSGSSIRVLEIGALSSDNAISGFIGKGVNEVKRIDLHSQDKTTIEEIDFMELPIPDADEDKYDVISLSLVLNYVPEAAQRGAMLQRTVSFLRTGSLTAEEPLRPELTPAKVGRRALPCIFVVLPLPCLSNSRYMTQQHFTFIMRSLGYRPLKSYDSQKLAYMLFGYSSPNIKQQQHHENALTFRKTELRAGRDRNNFAITFGPE